MSQLAIIVAVAENGVIGSDNALPWHLPEDLRYFKRVTMGKPIVMGRKTFEAIGKPLPGRTNIVVTRNPAFRAEGAEVVPSVEAALGLAGHIAQANGVDEAVVIGGAEIYQATIPVADRLYITEVHARIEGDAVLPAIDWSRWREVGRDPHKASPYDYSFVRYERVAD